LTTLLRGSIEGTIASADFATRIFEWLQHLLGAYPVGTMPATISRAGTAVERARAHLQAHPSEALPLSDLVALTGVTTSHLVRSFSRTVGLPPKNYHAQIRLARARRLLAEGKSATSVAYDCGFADQSHLSRRFKEFYGQTPGAFQAQYRAPGATAAVPESSGNRLAGAGFNAA
jgi:AraC-like DNA-binding protein